MPKRSIRSLLLAERKALTRSDCQRLSAAIQDRFLRSSYFRSSSCIALYHAVQGEVITDAVFSRAIEAGKRLVYPRVRGDELDFVDVMASEDFTPGAFNVPEPVGKITLSLKELDLVVVPGIAFDRRGHRLGYGRGYYDRAMAGCRPDCVKVGFSYDFQLLPELPAAEHDVPLSALITESQSLNFSSDRS